MRMVTRVGVGSVTVVAVWAVALSGWKNRCRELYL